MAIDKGALEEERLMRLRLSGPPFTACPWPFTSLSLPFLDLSLPILDLLLSSVFPWPFTAFHCLSLTATIWPDTCLCGLPCPVCPAPAPLPTAHCGKRTMHHRRSART